MGQLFWSREPQKKSSLHSYDIYRMKAILALHFFQLSSFLPHLNGSICWCFRFMIVLVLVGFHDIC